MLAGIAQGHDFAALCAVATGHVAAADAAGEVLGLLQSWLGDALLIA